MGELDPFDVPDALPGQSFDISEAIVSLRRLGAEKFDPLRLHYLQVLAHRAKAYRGPVKNILDAKLVQALGTFRERFAQAQSDAKEDIVDITKQFPHARANLQHLLESGDFCAVRQTIASLKNSKPAVSLGELALYLDKQSPVYPANANFEGVLDADSGSRPELKTVRNFRNTWSKLSVEKRVAQEMDQAPKNAGPINSHMLVLRSLVMMRDISPDYLNRFTSYMDTLLCLDQSDREKLVIAKKASEGENNKKAKNRRSKSR